MRWIDNSWKKEQCLCQKKSDHRSLEYLYKPTEELGLGAILNLNDLGV
jgi:hypothetical protein